MENVFAQREALRQQSQTKPADVEANVFAQREKERLASNQKPTTLTEVNKGTLFGAMGLGQGAPIDPETGQPAEIGEQIKDVGRALVWGALGLPELGRKAYNYLVDDETRELGLSLEQFASPPKYAPGKALELIGMGGTAGGVTRKVAEHFGFTRAGRIKGADQQAEQIVKELGVESAVRAGHLPHTKMFNVRDIEHGKKVSGELYEKAAKEAGAHSLLQSDRYYSAVTDRIPWADLSKAEANALMVGSKAKGMTVSTQQLLLKRINMKLNVFSRAKERGALTERGAIQQQFYVETKEALEGLELAPGAAPQALKTYKQASGLRFEIGELERIKDGVLNAVHNQIRLATGGEKTPVQALQVLKNWEKKLTPIRIETALGAKRYRAFQQVKILLQKQGQRELDTAGKTSLGTALGILGVGGGAYAATSYIRGKGGAITQTQPHGPRMATTVKGQHYGKR